MSEEDKKEPENKILDPKPQEKKDPIPNPNTQNQINENQDA